MLLLLLLLLLLMPFPLPARIRVCENSRPRPIRIPCEVVMLAEPNHRCRAWGVHAVGRVRRATGCADAGAKWRVPMQRRTKKPIVTWMAAQRLSPNVPPKAE